MTDAAIRAALVATMQATLADEAVHPNVPLPAPADWLARRKRYMANRKKPNKPTPPIQQP